MLKLLGLLILSLASVGNAANSPTIAVTENVSASNGTIFVSTPNGRVGISTDVPQAVLDVRSPSNTRSILVSSNVVLSGGILDLSASPASGVKYYDGSISTTGAPNPNSSGGGGSGCPFGLGLSSMIVTNGPSTSASSFARVGSSMTINIVRANDPIEVKCDVMGIANDTSNSFCGFTLEQDSSIYSDIPANGMLCYGNNTLTMGSNASCPVSHITGSNNTTGLHTVSIDWKAGGGNCNMNNAFWNIICIVKEICQ